MKIEEATGSGGRAVAVGAERAAPRCRDCADCEGRRNEVGPPALIWNRIEQLHTPGEVIGFPGIIARTELTHVGDPDGILRRYDLSTDVPCSMRGQHPHRKGIIVQMLCGITVRMGFDCGAKSIIGFETVKKNFDRRVRFESDRRRLETWADGYVQEMSTLRPFLEARRDVCDSLAHGLPKLHEELRRRWRQRDGRSLEVRGEPGRLVGLAIVNAEKYDVENMRSVLVRFEQQHHDSPPSDGASAAALLAIARRGDRLIDSARGWIRETTGFTTASNLELALKALGQPDPSVRRSGRGFRVTHFGSGAGAQLVELQELPAKRS